MQLLANGGMNVLQPLSQVFGLFNFRDGYFDVLFDVLQESLITPKIDLFPSMDAVTAQHEKLEKYNWNTILFDFSILKDMIQLLGLLQMNIASVFVEHVIEETLLIVKRKARLQHA